MVNGVDMFMDGFKGKATTDTSATTSNSVWNGRPTTTKVNGWPNVQGRAIMFHAEVDDVANSIEKNRMELTLIADLLNKDTKLLEAAIDEFSMGLGHEKKVLLR